MSGPLAEGPARFRVPAPRDAEGRLTDVHDLALHVCCDDREPDAVLVIREYEYDGLYATFEVPAIEPGIYAVTAVHTAAPVGSRPLVADGGIPLPEPGGLPALLAGLALLLALGYRRRR